jgi:hypothetical protein
MNFNFFDAVKDRFNNELVSKAAGVLGETESEIKTGLDAIVPISLTGIVNKAQYSPESIFRFSRDASNITDIANAFRPGGGGVPFSSSSFLTTILGEKSAALTQTVSNFTGLKGSSVSALFASVVPLALGVLGKHTSEKNLRPNAMGLLLDSQKSLIMSKIPAGLNVSELLPARSTVVKMPLVVDRKARNTWRTPVLIALALLILLWWLFKKAPKDATRAIPNVGQVLVTAGETQIKEIIAVDFSHE